MVSQRATTAVSQKAIAVVSHSDGSLAHHSDGLWLATAIAFRLTIVMALWPTTVMVKL